MKAYKVKNWNQLFENAESRKYKSLKHVLIPRRMDGLGFRTLSEQKRAPELFAAWILILEIAAEGESSNERGWLIRDGKPLTAQDCALICGKNFKKSIFERAFEFFTQGNNQWLEFCDVPESKPVQEISNSVQKPRQKACKIKVSENKFPGTPGDDPEEPEKIPKDPEKSRDIKLNSISLDLIKEEETRKRDSHPPATPPPALNSFSSKSNSEKPSAPTRSEILKYAEAEGIPIESALNFFDHWTPRQWLTDRGKSLLDPIAWRSRLNRWAREDAKKETTFKSDTGKRNSLESYEYTEVAG
jgi:hypothetical protein